MSLKNLGQGKPELWQQYFNHYVFEQNGDPAVHLAPNEKGILHPMSSQLAA